MINLKEEVKEAIKEAIKVGNCKKLNCSECRKLTKKSEEHTVATVCFRNHLEEFKNIVK